MGKIVVDCKGMPCPMPIVKLSVAMRAANPGDEVEITTNDPNFAIDVRSWARTTGNALVRLDVGDGTYIAVLCKVG